MTTLTRRRTSPLAEVLGWLDKETDFMGLGLTPSVRVEDFVEDGVYVLRAEMPGINPDKDVQVDVSGDLLTISGERREEHKDRRRREFHYGSFERTVTLPRDAKVDEVQASYQDGVLEVRVPLDGETPRATHVPIQRPEG